ncbi:MAG: hypothetical protein K2J72_08550 [Oscillospiraceae bacterium]|nr:hypothetical protein [Oscillospiraceae bacterium]
MELNIFEQIVLPCLYSLVASIAFGVEFNIKLRHMITAGIGLSLIPI